LTEPDNSNPDSAKAWRRFIKQFMGSLAAILAALYLAILYIDPYDSGQLTSSPVTGVIDDSARTANASRGRDLQFNSAVIGNSRAQLLDPKRLSDGTGLSFVQLSTHSTGPLEQLILLRWFAEHHSRIEAIVLAADTSWCTQEEPLTLQSPFPLWLYSEHVSDYLVNVFRTRSLRQAWRRAQLLLGAQTRDRADGYEDFEIGRTWSFHPSIPAGFEPAALHARAPEMRFPGIERLRAPLAAINEDMALVIVRPPAFFSELPAAGTPAADHIAQCKGALAALAGEHRHASFLDFEVDGEIARNPENFWDPLHYRAPIARMMEDAIISALRRERTGQISDEVRMTMGIGRSEAGSPAR
jgi:hypothetical protein